MIIRKSFKNNDIWGLVQAMLPNEEIIEIETWKLNYLRIMMKAGQGVNYLIVDAGSKLVAYPKGDIIQSAGAFLKVIRDGKEGLIDVVDHFNPKSYTWHEIIPCDYSKIIDYLDYRGLIRVIKDGNWGVIDRFNRIIVPFEYAHLSPIVPLVDGRYHIIARKDSDQPEFNLFLSDNYSIDIGDQDVPRLTGEVICSIGKQY